MALELLGQIPSDVLIKFVLKTQWRMLLEPPEQFLSDFLIKSVENGPGASWAVSF